MATKVQGSGVTFKPDPTMAGPYNYTRADIPIFAPGYGYNQTIAAPPGTPATTPPPASPPTAPTAPTPAQKAATQATIQSRLNNIAANGAVRPMAMTPLASPNVQPSGRELASPWFGTVANPIPDMTSGPGYRTPTGLPQINVSRTSLAAALAKPRAPLR